MYTSAISVMKDRIIPSGAGYNIGSANWPKISSDGGQASVNFGGGNKTSMCTSATATAFLKHIADLVNSGQLKLNDKQLQFLNGSAVRNALNGDTNSVAVLYNYLGGKSMQADSISSIRKVLSQAKKGDVLKIDRFNKTGHSTIFKGMRGNQFCYWTSNTATGGTGERCESISELQDVVVSRFPANLSDIPVGIDNMMKSGNLASLLRSSTTHVSNKNIQWASSLDCDSPRSPANAPAPEATDTKTQR